MCNQYFLFNNLRNFFILHLFILFNNYAKAQYFIDFYDFKKNGIDTVIITHEVPKINKTNFTKNITVKYDLQNILWCEYFGTDTTIDSRSINKINDSLIVKCNYYYYRRYINKVEKNYCDTTNLKFARYYSKKDNFESKDLLFDKEKKLTDFLDTFFLNDGKISRIVYCYGINNYTFNDTIKIDCDKIQFKHITDFFYNNDILIKKEIKYFDRNKVNGLSLFFYNYEKENSTITRISYNDNGTNLFQKDIFSLTKFSYKNGILVQIKEMEFKEKIFSKIKIKKKGNVMFIKEVVE